MATIQQAADLYQVSRRLLCYTSSVFRFGSPLIKRLVEEGKCPSYIAAAFIKLFPDHAAQDEIAGAEDGVRKMRFYVKVCKRPKSSQAAVTALRKLWNTCDSDAQLAMQAWIADQEPDDDD